MTLQFTTGQFKINKYGDDHYDIRIGSRLDTSKSSLQFLTKEQLREIRNKINGILRESAEQISLCEKDGELCQSNK